MRIQVLFFALALAPSCGDGGADDLGVGGQCGSDSDCPQTESSPALTCLKQFKGGYCGIADCTSTRQCPSQSACVKNADGHNYCYRTCNEKLECNANRASDNESNCSSNIEYVDSTKDEAGKACVPPSSG